MKSPALTQGNIITITPSQSYNHERRFVVIFSGVKRKWPLFKFLGWLFENEALGYNGGIFIT